MADAVLVAAKARVKAGKVPPIEASRATVAVNRTQLTVLEAQGRLTVARQRLAIQWGDAHPSFPSAAGALDVLPARPELPDVLYQLKDHPALARWPDEMQRRRSELELASAQAVPNVVVSGGFRHFAENDDMGVVFGVSVPLPLFNRNQGAILSAQATMEAADAALEVARRSLLAEVHEQYQALITASAEDDSLRLNALPLARQVFEATQIGYREGKFSLFEVLDAQRALFETRSAQVEAEARYQIAIAELERLTAKSVDAIAEEKPSAAGDPP